MAKETVVTTQKQNIVLASLVGELRDIKVQLNKLLLLIPEESLQMYTNNAHIKQAHRKATMTFPPKG